MDPFILAIVAVLVGWFARGQWTHRRRVKRRREFVRLFLQGRRERKP